MRAALVSMAGGLGALRLTEWVHEVAGVAGDVGLIVAGTSAVVVVGRKVASRTRRAWDTIELVAEQTEVVPEIASKLDRHIADTTAQFEAGSQKFARIEQALEALAEDDAASIRRALRRTA